MYAIKKFKATEDDEQTRKVATREVNLLRLLRHPSIVRLHEVIRRRRRFYLVFEHVEHTVLTQLESSPAGLSPLTIKRLVYQLVIVLAHCHEKGVSSRQVVHRDVKPENLLVSEEGHLKLCDFGFARPLAHAPGNMTEYVSTRWYRAPELLIGLPYNTAVDVWAVGCLFAELSTGRPLFPGNSDLHTLHLIEKLTHANSSTDLLREKLPKLSPAELQFVRRCLAYKARDRATCLQLLADPYFDEEFKTGLDLPQIELNSSRNKLSRNIQKSSLPMLSKRDHSQSVLRKHSEIQSRQPQVNSVARLRLKDLTPSKQLNSVNEIARVSHRTNRSIRASQFSKSPLNLYSPYSPFLEEGVQLRLLKHSRASFRSLLKARRQVKR